MRVSLVAATTSLLFAGSEAARPFWNEPDTGIEDVLGNLETGSLPKLTDMVALNDFDWTARHYLPKLNYTYYRNGAGGEWSYRNNIEVFNRYRLRPRVVVDITSVNSSMPTSILGHNFSAPFFISPCARAAYGHPGAEANLVKGAAAGNILYIPSGYSSLPMEEIRQNAAEGQIIFNQLYLTNNDTATKAQFERAEKAGASAIVWTVDSPGSPSRQRAARFNVGSANTVFVRNTWEEYAKLKSFTKLPIVIKGIQTAADARAAVDNGVPAIILSNHGGRNLDGSPSPLEVALEIHQNDPDVFKSTEVLADSGVRYGTDALRLLALGVRAVGVGRPFMYANIFGLDGIKRAVDILKSEIVNDAANLGVGDIKKITPDFVNWNQNGWYS